MPAAARRPADPGHLRDLRRAAGFTMERLAVLAGLSVKTLSLSETYSGAASPRTLAKLANALGVRVAALTDATITSAPASVRRSPGRARGSSPRSGD